MMYNTVMGKNVTEEQKMTTCKIISEIKDGSTVYGFKFYDKQNGEEVCTVRDVFTDENAAHALCEAINETGVCRDHIPDIIEDAVGSM